MWTDKIRRKYQFAVKSTCCDSGCCLKLAKGANENVVVLKGEKLSQENKICDCLIFYANSEITIAELKSRSINTSSILSKFENGGKMATKIAAYAGVRKPTIHIVLLAKKYKNHVGVSRLVRTTVRIPAGQSTVVKHKIQLRKCGTSLYSIK